MIAANEGFMALVQQHSALGPELAKTLDFGQSAGSLYDTSQEQAMTRLATPQIATMTELREPQKVLDRANGQPIAILKNSTLVGYLVPASAVSMYEPQVATMEAVMESMARRRAVNRPVLDYLKDK